MRSRARLAAVLPLLLIALLKGPPSSAASGPRIEADETVFDFGTVDETVTVEHSFTVRNTGDAPLRILNVESSCGCTTTHLEGSIIPPGEGTALVAKFNPRGRRGRQEKSIYISSNDPVKPQLVFKMSGSVVSEVELNPMRVDFLDAGGDKPLERELRLTNTSSKPLHVTGMQTSGTFFKVRQSPVEDGRSYLFAIRTVPPLASGVSRGTITLRTDHPKYPVITVPVTAQVAADVVAAPNVVAIPDDGDPRKPYSFVVAVRSRSDKPFKITGIEFPQPSATSRVQAVSLSSYKVTIGNIDPRPELSGKWVRITTDSSSVREIRLPIQVYKRAQPPRPFQGGAPVK